MHRFVIPYAEGQTKITCLFRNPTYFEYYTLKILYFSTK